MKATLKKLTGKGDRVRTVPKSASPASPAKGSCAVSGDVRMFASCGDIKIATPNQQVKQRSASSDSSSSSSSNSSSSSGGSSELSSFAQSSRGSVKQPPEAAMRHRFKRPDSPRVIPRGASICRDSSTSSSSSSGSSSGDAGGFSYGNSTSCSVPDSEAFWSELPAMKPLINPGRLQALRLCSRDQQQAAAADGGDATILASPTSPALRPLASDKQQQQQQQQQREQSDGADADADDQTHTSHTRQNLTVWQATATAAATADCNQCNDCSGSGGAVAAARRSSGKQQPPLPPACKATATASAASSRDLQSWTRATGATELKMAESASCPRHAIYQYSFRVPDTRANMRAFTNAGDRRVESIARACDSEILLDPEPIRPGASSNMRLRRVTVRAPDPHSLEKCCRMFDTAFPQFYVTGGLGPGGRGVSKVYDDADEKYISASHDELS